MPKKQQPTRKSSAKVSKAAPAKSVAAKAMATAAKPVTKTAVKAASKPALNVAAGKVAAKPAKKMAAAPAAKAVLSTSTRNADKALKNVEVLKQVKKMASEPAVEKAAPREQQIVKAKAALKKESTEALPKASSKGRGRKVLIDIDPNEAATALSGKWNTLFKKADQIETNPYNMKAVFEEKTAIVHKVLGWGYILANRNDRLEVLFKDGIKYLISNYKP